MTAIQRTSPAPASEAGAVVGEVISAFDYSVLSAEDRLAAQQAAREIREEEQNAVAAAIKIGRRLVDVKQRLGRGRFGSWLETEFRRWSPRTAENYMKVFKAFGDHAGLPDLDIDVSALYLLAAPSTPEDLRQDVLERAAAGEEISHEMVKALLATSKTPALPEPAPALPEPPPPVIIVEDAALFEIAEASSSIGEGYLDYGRIKKPFLYQDKLWISVGGAYGGGEDQRDCVRVVPVGTPYTPGESLGYRQGSYCGRRAWYRSTEYELTGQYLRVIRQGSGSVPADQPAPPPSADPEEDYEQRIVAEAARHGLLLDWQDDGRVVVRWPGEGAAQRPSLAPAEALRWLRDDAPAEAARRAAQTECEQRQLPPGWWLERQDEAEPGRAGRSRYRAMSDGPVSNWYEAIGDAVAEAWEIAGSPEPQAQQAEAAPQPQPQAQPDADPGRFLIALAQGSAWRAPVNASAEVEFWPGLLATARAILDGRLDALLAEAGLLEDTAILSYLLVYAADALWRRDRAAALAIAARPQDPAARLALQQAVLALEQRMSIPPELPEDLRAAGCSWRRNAQWLLLVDPAGEKIASGFPEHPEGLIEVAREVLDRRRAAALPPLEPATPDIATFLAALLSSTPMPLSGPYVTYLVWAARTALSDPDSRPALDLPAAGSWPVAGPTLRSTIAHAAEALRRGDRATALALPERLFWGQDVRAACQAAIEALEIRMLQQEAEAQGERLDWQAGAWTLYVPDVAAPVARFDSAESARAGLAWRREQRRAAQAEQATAVAPPDQAGEERPASSWTDADLDWLDAAVQARNAFHEATGTNIMHGWGTPAQARQRLAELLADLLVTACPSLGAVGEPMLSALLGAENRHQVGSMLVAMARELDAGEREQQ